MQLGIAITAGMVEYVHFHKYQKNNELFDYCAYLISDGIYQVASGVKWSKRLGFKDRKSWSRLSKIEQD